MEKVMPEYIIRDAKKDEAFELAKLINYAGKSNKNRGLDLYGWSLDAKDGEDPFEVGAREIAEGNSNYSYKNIRVVEADGKIAALAMSFKVRKKTSEEMEQVFELFRIFKHLTNTIDGCYYLDSLASSPDFRGMGYGRMMLEDSIHIARQGNFDAIYLIAFDENIPAVTLYEKTGFYPIRKLPVPEHPEMPFGGNAVLFRKDL